jgi:kynurenine formamidase
VLATGLVGAQATKEKGQPSAAHKLEKKDVQEMMKSLSNWGRWGKQDQLGTMNLITPEKKRRSAQLIKEGFSVSLARNVIKVKSDGSEPFEHSVKTTSLSSDLGSAGDRYCVDYHGFTQTHLDALCHLFYMGKMYNGYSQNEVTQTGAGKLSVIQMKSGLATRGVLMDIPRLLGQKYLNASRAIYPEDLQAWEKKAGLQVESGDIILIRTGRWARRAAEGEWDIMKGSAGLHASCLPWLKKRDVAIIGSDLATDVMPSGVEDFLLPVHWVAIVAMGTPILDNCDLELLSEEANRRSRWAFFITAGPLAVEGGTGSPINPIAIF